VHGVRIPIVVEVYVGLTTRILTVLVIAALIGAVSPSGSAQGTVRVFVDSNRVAFDQPPVVLDGRVLVPLRGIFEQMGATVEWENATRTVLAVRGSTVVELVIGRRSAQVNNRTVPMDVPAMIIGGRTLVPLRFISEAMGATVQWQEDTRTVLIFSSGAPAGQPPAPQPAPTQAPAGGSAQTVTGTIVEIRTGENPRITVERGQTLTRAMITPETAITRINLSTNSGGSVSLNAVKVGDEAEVRVAQDGKAERVRATYRSVVGRIDTLAAQGRTIVLANGQAHKMADENVEVLINDRPSEAANLRPGMVVTLRLNPTSNLVYGVAAEAAAAQEPATRPARPTIALPEANAVIANPVEIRGAAQGAARVRMTIDAMLGVRLASGEDNVGPRGGFRFNMNYTQPPAGWPMVITVVAINRAGLESDPTTITVRQR